MEIQPYFITSPLKILASTPFFLYLWKIFLYLSNLCKFFSIFIEKNVKVATLTFPFSMS